MDDGSPEFDIDRQSAALNYNSLQTLMMEVVFRGPWMFESKCNKLQSSS